MTLLEQLLKRKTGLLGNQTASPATATKSTATKSPATPAIPALPGWMSQVPTGAENPFSAPVAPSAPGAQDVVGGNSTEEIMKRRRKQFGILAALGASETGGYSGNGLITLLSAK